MSLIFQIKDIELVEMSGADSEMALRHSSKISLQVLRVHFQNLPLYLNQTQTKLLIDWQNTW